MEERRTHQGITKKNKSYTDEMKILKTSISFPGEPIVISKEQVREYVEHVHDPIEIKSNDEVHVVEEVHADESESDEDFVQDDKDALGDSEFDDLDEDDWIGHMRKLRFLATYSYIVLSSNGPRLWPVTNGEIINPPVTRRASGRPKKKRNRANDEPTSSNVLPRNLTTVKCKSCGTL
ncbi:hypothetical protein KIW84_041812 [Lathyrus oleraceus]|uniref:Uncharacterized protein n=1 Tax=Pisum sativum TaxID=3888 RepID=A0A9D4XCM6_PEA|nr:hypothetical protein KIW84_041812 [Pisum sativum]